MKISAKEKTAITFKKEIISYKELVKNINSYSDLLKSYNPDKVAILSENRPEWAYALLGAWKNNTSVVPIDFMSTNDEISYILKDCHPEAIFVSNEFYDKISDIISNIDLKIQIINFDKIELKTTTENFDEFIKEPNDDTALIIYTSGTTGNPKGVMLSYENLETNIKSVSEHIKIFTEERNVLVLLPLHHIFPLLGSMIAPLNAGATIAFSPSMNSEDIITTLQENKISIIIGVPRLYDAIRKGIMDKINKSRIIKALFNTAKVINSRTFSKKLFKKVHERFGGKIEYLVSGGAKLNEEVAKDFKVLGFEILEGYGMTEAAPMITFTRPSKWKIGSAGQALHGLDLQIVGGEIRAKGKNIMKGYYNRPEETAAVIKEGWLHTCDTGYIDKEGYLYITGRSKEIIVLSNGKNINPEEIETKLKEISELISETAVIERNDSLTAVVYPNFKAMIEKGIVNIEEHFRAEIIDKYNRTANPYKRITKFVLSKNELPKTRLGKLQRFRLADELEKGLNKKKEIKEEPDFEEYIVIRDFLKEQKKGDIAPDDHLEIDLGLDSLDRINLQVFLESTFGIKVQEETFIHHPTVEKLSRFMKEKKNKIHVESVKWAEILKEKAELKLPKGWITQNFIKHISKLFFKLYFRFNGEGTEKLPQGPFILAPNHQSFFDGLFVSVFLKNQVFRNTYFYAKEKHVRNPLIKAIANRHNIIIMDINKDLKTSLQKLAAILKSGKNVIIFPEGTRTYNGELGEFKKSFAILSSELNVPVVPVSINGAIDAMPKGSLIPRPWKKIKVKFHLPVYPEGKNYEAITSEVYQELAEELS